MIKIFIIGFPRTATSKIYSICCRTTKFCLYEPFNPDVILSYLNRSKYRHDRVGYIKSDYYDLKTDILKELALNSLWVYYWSNAIYDREPYLGSKYSEILKKIDKIPDSFTIKDVYAWPKILELLTLFPKAKFIIPIRAKEYVFRSFLKWYKNRHIILSVLKMIINKLFLKYNDTKLYEKSRQNYIFTNRTRLIDCNTNIRRTIINKINEHKTLNNSNFMSLGIFYNYFKKQSIENLKDPIILKMPSSIVGPSKLKYLINNLYDRYIKLAIKANMKNSKNVLILKFKNRLKKEHLEIIEKFINNC